eukprot:4873704-Amphidinium_carterae.1
MEVDDDSCSEPGATLCRTLMLSACNLCTQDTRSGCRVLKQLSMNATAVWAAGEKETYVLLVAARV